MATRRNRTRAGLADSAGRAALFPARVAARAWRGRLESAADEVLSAPEIARVVDRALAGSLPEEIARSLVRHQVIERVVRELAATGELQRLIEKSLESPQTLELTDRVLGERRDAAHAAERRLQPGAAQRRREAIRRARRGRRGGRPRVGGAPRPAGRSADHALRDRSTQASPPAPRRSRSTPSLALSIFVLGSGVVALVASLVGGIRPQWLAGSLLGVGWLLVAGGYFVLFWSAAGQTPGMGLMRLRVRRPEGGGVSAGRAIVRAIGLALAIIPLFAGFLPALFDARRRALPDLLAGTVVVYDEGLSPKTADAHPDEPSPRVMTAHPARRDDLADEKGGTMAIGPVQLIVLGFDEPEFKGEVLAELDRLKENDIVRVIDGLAVYKDEKGEVTTIKRTDLSDEEAAEFGAVVGALIGLGVAGEEGAEAGAQAGAEATAEGVDVFHEQDVIDVIDEIPNNSAAALILLEHRWAIPCATLCCAQTADRSWRRSSTHSTS